MTAAGRCAVGCEPEHGHWRFTLARSVWAHPGGVHFSQDQCRLLSFILCGPNRPKGSQKKKIKKNHKKCRRQRRIILHNTRRSLLAHWRHLRPQDVGHNARDSRGCAQPLRPVFGLLQPLPTSSCSESAVQFLRRELLKTILAKREETLFFSNKSAPLTSQFAGCKTCLVIPSFIADETSLISREAVTSL